MATREERAARVLDECMHIAFVRLVPSLRLYTHDVTGLDAVDRVIGVKRRAFVKRSGCRQWRCQEEWDIGVLLKVCVPYMRERKELAEAVLEYLDAKTPKELLAALRKTQEVDERLRRHAWEDESQTRLRKIHELKEKLG